MNAPTLDDDRIDTMRGVVMAAVRTDLQRRARRTRRLIGAGVAAALVVVVGGVGTSLVQSSQTASSDSSSSEISSGADSGAVTEPADAGALAAPAQRQVITTGRATVVVGDPRREAARTATWVEALGGRVDAREEQGTDDDASARLTVRVPTKRVDAAVERLADSGRVESVSFQDEDVTATVVDLDARIRALRISVERLEDILAEADSSDQVLEAETALTDRQAQLESLVTQRSSVGEDVALARIDIDLVQREGTDDVEPGGFRGGLTDGWNALVGAVNAVVEGAGVVLPWAVVALVVLGVVRLAGRARRRT